MSFGDCLRVPQLADVNTFRTTVYGSDFTDDSVTIADPDAGKLKYSSDNLYSCNSAKIPYIQKLQPTRLAAVVFASPSLIYAVGEQLEALKHARSSCSQLLAAYNSYLINMPLLDSQARLQQSIQYLSAWVEFYTLNANPNVGVLKLGDQSVPSFAPPSQDLQNLTPNCKLPPPAELIALISGLRFYRICATTVAAVIRENVKNATGVDYEAKFRNAQQAIDTQTREVARALLALDSAEITSFPPRSIIEEQYKTGTWVQKGTVVLSVGP
jgi:hypothetical protein